MKNSLYGLPYELLRELTLHGSVKFTLNDGTHIATIITAGGLGDYVLYFPDGTHWSSTEYAERMFMGQPAGLISLEEIIKGARIVKKVKNVG